MLSHTIPILLTSFPIRAVDGGQLRDETALSIGALLSRWEQCGLRLLVLHPENSMYEHIQLFQAFLKKPRSKHTVTER